MDTLPFGNSLAATNTAHRAAPASTGGRITAQERMNYHRSFDVVARLTTGALWPPG